MLSFSDAGIIIYTNRRRLVSTMERVTELVRVHLAPREFA